MAIKKILGRIPVTRDGYQSGVTYYRDNIVTYSSCAFICTEDGTTVTPATITADGEIICNAGWSIFASRGIKGDKGDKGDSGSKGDKGDKGDDGRSMENVNTYYALVDDADSEPADSMFTYDTVNAVVISSNGEKWLWSADKITYSDGTTVFTGKYCIGQCKTLATVFEEYGISDNANKVPEVFSSSYPTQLEKGTYLWTRDVIVWRDGTTTYSEAQLAGYIGTDGEKGDPGRDGDTEEYCFRQFADKDAFETYASEWVEGVTMESKAEKRAVPDGWTDHPEGVDGTQYKIEAVSRREIGDTFGEWSKPAIWSNWGVEGKDGDGVEYVFYLTSNDATKPVLFAGSNDSYYRSDGKIITTADEAYQESGFLPCEKNGTEYLPWFDDIASPTVEMKALWVASRKRKDGVWLPFSEPKFWARYASDGKDGDSVTATVYFTNPSMDIYPSEDDPTVFDYSDASSEIVFINGGTEVYFNSVTAYEFAGYTADSDVDGQTIRYKNSDSSVIFDVTFNTDKRSTLQIVSMTVQRVKILMSVTIGKAADTATLEAELDVDGRIEVTASKLSFRYKGQDATAPADTTAIELKSDYYKGFTTANTWWEYCVGGVWTKLPADRLTGDSLSVTYDDALWGTLNELSIRKYGEIHDDSGELIESDYDTVTLYRLYDGADGQYTSVVFCRSKEQPATPTSTKPVPDGWSTTQTQGYVDVNPSIASGNWTADGNVFTSNKISDGEATWSKISFTTTEANAVVALKITASSEPSYDKGYIGKLDSAYSTSSYLARVDGTTAKTVSITVATAGQHYIYVGYTKDQSNSKNNDNAVVEFLGSDDVLWMTNAIVTDGVAGTWSTPVRFEGIRSNTSFKSIVFKRSNDASVSAPDSSEGSYTKPIPESGDWSDGIPAGSEQIWMTTRVFSSDGKYPQQSAWTTPQVVSDNQYMDYEFSSVSNPGVPNKETPSSEELNANWSNTADETTIWMAVREVSNGAYPADSAWKIMKIKGEKGEDGTGISIKGTLSGEDELPSSGNTAGDAYIINGDLYVWDGDSWENCGRIQGNSSYIHVAFSDDEGKTLTGNNGRDIGKYFGFKVTETDERPLVASEYTWSKFQGEDGFGYEFIYKSTAEDVAPDVPSSSNVDEYVPDGWSDDPIDVTESVPYCWMCYRKKTDGVWGDYKGSSTTDKAVLFIKYAKDGTDGKDGISPNTSFKSIVFRRSNTTPDTPGASEGSYADPKPSLWSDGVPSGDEQLWMTTRIFSSDGKDPQQSAWTTPQPVSDNKYMDYEFSSVENPGTPDKDSPAGDELNANWSNTADETTIWMAMREVENGEYAAGSSWKILKVKGESGEDGTSLSIKGTLTSKDELPASGNIAGDAYIIGGDLYVWDGDSWENCGRIQGEPGATPYLHIKYSDDGGVTFTANKGETPGKYIGMYTDYNSKDSETIGDYAPWKKWVGEDGFGYEYIYKPTADSEAPSVPTTSEQVDDYVPDGWYDDIVSVSEELPYCWVCYRKKTDGVWGAFIGSSSDKSKAALWAYYGQGAYTEFRYAVNGSTVSAPALVTTDLAPAGWTVKQPEVQAGYYLWETHATISGDGKKLLQEWSAPIRKTPEKGKDGSSHTAAVYFTNPMAKVFPSDDDSTVLDYSDAQTEIVFMNGSTEVYSDSLTNFSFPGYTAEQKDSYIRYTRPGNTYTETSNAYVIFDLYLKTDGRSVLKLESLGGPGKVNIVMVIAIGESTASASFEAGIDLNGRITVTANKLAFRYADTDATVPEDTADIVLTSSYYLDFNTENTIWEYNLDGVWTRLSDDRATGDTLNITYDDVLWNGKNELGIRKYGRSYRSFISGSDSPSYTIQEDYDAVVLYKFYNGKDAYSPYVGDNGNWYFYNDETKQFEDSRRSATGDDGHSPYVGTNGNWYEYNAETGAYEDTGIRAKGNDAPYYEYRYAKNTSATTPPSITNTARTPDGWTTAIPSLDSVNAEYIWWTIAKISADGASLVENWSTPVRFTPKDGEKGDKGDSPALVYRGEYDTDNNTTYYGNAYRVDAVNYNGAYYVARVDAGTIKGTLPTNTEKWNPFGSSFESVATKLLLAEEANIAGWIYRNGRMESQTTDSDGNPMAYMDGTTGKIVAQNAEISGKITATSGTINGLTVTKTSSPFGKMGTNYSTPALFDTFDNGYGDFSGGSSTSISAQTLPCDVSQSGRRITMMGEFLVKVNSSYYIWDNGLKVQQIYATDEIIEFLGYGTSTQFIAWVVMSRKHVKPSGGYCYGHYPFSPVAFGKVTCTSSGSVSLTQCSIESNSSNGTPIGVYRESEGLYELMFPCRWFTSVNDVFLILTGFNTAGVSNVKPCVESIETDNAGLLYYAHISLADDSTPNDGGFQFMLFSLSALTNVKN